MVQPQPQQPVVQKQPQPGVQLGVQQHPVIQQQQVIQQQPIVQPQPLQQSVGLQHQPNIQQQPVQQNQQVVIQQKPIIQQALPQASVVQQQSNVEQVQSVEKQQQPVAQQKSVKNKEPIDNYMAQVALKHGLEAYDRELQDIHKILDAPNEDQVVPGRDLKDESRSKRSASDGIEQNYGFKDSVKSSDINCLNDPFCEEKFSRNPVSDSLVDRDLTQFLKVGKRSLLKIESEQELNSTDGRGL